jgi:chromosome segregation ATPase
MDEIKKMLKIVINDLSSLKQQMGKMEKRLDKKIDGVEERLSNKIDKVDEKLTKRIDNLEKQLAYLEDDAPTREEFDGLEKRVGKLEQSTGSP